MAIAAPFGRTTALAVIVVAHAVVLSAFSLGRPDRVAARPATIALHEVPAVPRPETEPVLTLAALPVDAALPTVEIVADADAAPGGDCAIVDRLQAALADDRAVGRALDAIPASARSVANAVMVWDGRWADLSAPVRAAIVAQVRATPTGCRALLVTGPRLLVVPGRDRPVVLAFGSGTWRWGDLLAESNPVGRGQT